MTSGDFSLAAIGTFFVGVAALVSAGLQYRTVVRREKAVKAAELRQLESTRILNGAPEVIDRAIPLIIQAIYSLSGLGDDVSTQQLSPADFKRMETAAYIIGMLRGLPPASSSSQNKGKTQA